MTVAHWDDVPAHHRAKGEMDAVWQRVGDAAGTRRVGVNRVRVAPGKLPTPPHSHGASEELYFVLAGSGLAWQDGAVHEIRPRDCVIQRPNELEHTFVAGPDGLELLVFGTRHPTEIGWLPRSRAVRIGWPRGRGTRPGLPPGAGGFAASASSPWLEGRDDDPWDVEAAGEQLSYGEPAPRPANIVNVDEVEPMTWGEGRATSASLATRERSVLAGLHWERLAPGRRGSVPHCHSLEEEVFVILEGAATLELWPHRSRDPDGAVEEMPLRPGQLVARPPGTGVPHSFRGGPEGVTMLVYGMREPNDMSWYPRSRKIAWRGLGVIGRIEALDYFDGEPLEDD